MRGSCPYACAAARLDGSLSESQHARNRNTRNDVLARVLVDTRLLSDQQRQVAMKGLLVPQFGCRILVLCSLIFNCSIQDTYSTNYVVVHQGMLPVQA